MSVLIPNDEVFNYLAHGVERTLFNTTVDHWYSHVIRQHFLNKNIDVEKKRLIESWMQMNMLSFCLKYKEKKWKCRWRHKSLHKKENIHQLLMYIKCVIYNIELYNIEDNGVAITEEMKQDLELLNQWRVDVSDAIACQCPEYKECTWSE